MSDYLLVYSLRPHIKDIFQSISAKVGTGEPCCDWVSAKALLILMKRLV